MRKQGLIPTAAIVRHGLWPKHHHDHPSLGPVAPCGEPGGTNGEPVRAHGKKSTAKKAMPDQNVTNLQTALNKNGANVKVDGMMGPQTRSALRRYQQSNSLKATGSADSATRAKLGV